MAARENQTTTGRLGERGREKESERERQREKENERRDRGCGFASKRNPRVSKGAILGENISARALCPKVYELARRV